MTKAHINQDASGADEPQWEYSFPNSDSRIPATLPPSVTKFDRQAGTYGIVEGLEQTRKGKLKQLLITEFGASADQAEFIYKLASDFQKRADPEKMPVPNVAPMLYGDRSNRTRSNDSLSFLKEHYGSWLADVGGELSRAHLRKLDPKLVIALENHFRGSDGAEFSSLLPTRSMVADQKLVSALGDLPPAKDRSEALTRLASGQTPFKRRYP